MCRLSWFLDPGDWSKTAEVRLFFIFPGICTLSLGAVITPTMDHPMSMQPTNIVGPLTQQMNHLSLGTAGTIQSQDRIMVLHQLLCQYMTAAPMQGTYIPQYTPVPPTAVSIE
ncbi:hypothetical protein STEG23_032725, partial [Scotinomys teguina]